jgi:hypothetical protein
MAPLAIHIAVTAPITNASEAVAPVESACSRSIVFEHVAGATGARNERSWS